MEKRCSYSVFWNKGWANYFLRNISLFTFLLWPLENMSNIIRRIWPEKKSDETSPSGWHALWICNTETQPSLSSKYWQWSADQILFSFLNLGLSQYHFPLMLKLSFMKICTAASLTLFLELLFVDIVIGLSQQPMVAVISVLVCAYSSSHSFFCGRTIK